MIKAAKDRIIAYFPTLTGEFAAQAGNVMESEKAVTTEVKESPATKGWSPERRAAQAARARALKPWLKSTGPRSAAGKRCAKMNGLTHGHRSRKMQKLSKLLRAQQLFVARWRAGRYHPPKRRFAWLRNGFADLSPTRFALSEWVFSMRPPSCGTGPPDA